VRRAVTDAHDDWNPTIGALASDVETAVRAAVGARSLADLVDADVRRDAPAAPSGEPPTG